MAFDPDAFLAGDSASKGNFDPDAFLGNTPAPKQPSMLQKANAAIGKYVTEPVYGLGETVAQMATGAGAQAVGGLRGIKALASGEGLDEATRRIQESEQSMTYQPRSGAGKALTGAIGKGFEWANQKVGQVGGAVGEAVGGESGRAIGESIGEVALPIGMTLVGGAGALRGAKGVTVRDAAKATGELVSDIAQTPAFLKKSMQTGPTVEQVKASRSNAVQIDAANKMRELGLAVDPAAVNPTLTNRGLRAISGKDELNLALTEKNTTKATELIKKDMGISPDARIDMDTIKAMRDQADLPNQYIRNLGDQVRIDSPTVGELQGMKVRNPVVGEEATAGKINQLVDNLAARIEEGAMTAPEAMEHIRVFRENARDIRSKSELMTGDRQLATANTQMAKALEDSVARNLQQLAEQRQGHGYDKLLENFQKGRTDMARSYLLEDILDKNTGKIDFKKLSKEVADNPAVTGTTREIGEVVGNFPEAFTSRAPHGQSFLEKHVITRSTVPGALAGSVFGGPMGTAIGAGANYALSNALRSRLVGDVVQRGNRTKPQDFRPEWERNLRVDPMAAESIQPPGPPRQSGPLRLAEDYQKPLPWEVEKTVEPAVRETMGFAPEAAIQSQALRGQGARTPLGSMDFPSQAPNPNAPAILQQPANAGRAGTPVEFTPGGGMDFKTPVQKVHELPIEIQSEIQKYTKQAQNAMSQAEADQAMMMVEALKSMGTQEGLASNLQPMYQGSNPAGYPIQKTFDPRSEALRRR